jgi:hypothetical protein
LKPAEECVTTHPPKRSALKTDDAMRNAEHVCCVIVLGLRFYTADYRIVEEFRDIVNAAVQTKALVFMGQIWIAVAVTYMRCTP